MQVETREASVNTKLSEPHFDDERTLLSARPVVPLDRVKSESRRKTLLLTATITVAVVLGTLGARFVYYKRAAVLTNQLTFPELTSDVAGTYEEARLTPDVATGDEQVGLEETPTLHELENVTNSEVHKNSTGPRLRKARAARENNAPQTDSEKTTDEQKVSRRVSRWEERRERRARRNNGGSTSDLQRIEQIFEGSPRP